MQQQQQQVGDQYNNRFRHKPGQNINHESTDVKDVIKRPHISVKQSKDEVFVDAALPRPRRHEQ